MKKYVCIRQHEQTDCGAACLASVFKYYGLKVPVSKIREEAGTDKMGTNIFGLLEAAKKYGFDTKSVQATEEALHADLPVPFIAHVITENNLLHYIIIHKVTKNQVVVADPAKGIVKYSVTDFLKMWTNVLILIVPNENFIRTSHTKGILKRFFPLVIEQKWLFIRVLIASIILTAIGIVTSFYSQYLIDNVIPNRVETLLTAISVMAIVLYLIECLLEWYRSYLLTYISQKIDKRLFLDYYRHVLKLPMSFFGSRKTGDIIARFQDTGNIRDLISGATLTVILDTIMALAGGFILYLQDNMLFGICVIIVLLYAVVVFFFKTAIRDKNEKVMEENAQLSSRLIETLNGVLTIKAFNSEQQMNNETETIFKKLLKSIFGLNMSVNLQNVLKIFVQLLGGVAILWIGAYKVFSQEMTLGSLITFNMLLSYFSDPIKNLIDLQPQIQTAIIASERASEILDLETEESNTETISLNDFKKDIKLNDVDFRYGKRNLVLTKVNLTINKGEHVALVGESGGGKTTLAKLLLKLYTSENGNITIDGKDIKHFSNDSIRNKIAYVPQETFLLSGTILENLTLGLDNFDMADVEKVIKITKIEDFIELLPLKLKTYLDENGSNLSGGQRQRIAIARALLRKPDILILDEATSNLDSITEKAIQKTINEFNKEMTMILIAHRLNTIKNCDKIFVFDKGQVVESGNHKELMQKQGFYYSFYKGE